MATTAVVAQQQPTGQFFLPASTCAPVTGDLGQFVFVRRTKEGAVPTVTIAQPAATPEVATTASAEVVVPKKKSKLWLWLGIGLALLVGVGVVVFLIMRNKKRQRDQGQEVPFSDKEIDHLAQTNADASSGNLTPVEAAAAAARAAGGDAEDVQTAVLAAENIAQSDVADEIEENIEDEVELQNMRHGHYAPPALSNRQRAHYRRAPINTNSIF